MPDVSMEPPSDDPLHRQLYTAMSAARMAGTPLTIDHSEVLHRHVHARFLTAFPTGVPQPTEPSQMWCTAKLPDDVYWRAQAVHEAAHAVLSLLVGLTVQRISLAADRTTVEGGGSWVEGPGNAQCFTLEMLGPGHAQALWLEANGYEHPELRRCVLELGASGDQAAVDGLEADGFVIDRGQAVSDALRLFATSGVMTAIEAAGEQLLAVREMTGEQVAAVLDHHQVVRPCAIWVPGPEMFPER